MTPIPTVRARNIARSPDGVQPSNGGIPLSPATAGDHLAVHHFLRNVFQAPSSREFQTQQDEPTYEPRDRLLVKHRDRVVAHLRLLRREMRFGACHLPITCIADMATAPEHRRRGYASALLALAEQRMREEGSVLGVLRTRKIDFYRKRGWVVCGRHSYSVAAPHAILSHLVEREPATRLPVRKTGQAAGPLHVRYWRRVEQDGLTRLYAGDSGHAYGAFLRTDPGWQWIISRQAYDRIYVAVEGSPRLEPCGSSSRIVGYAVVKAGRILELITSPRRPDAAEQLLARVGGDAIEMDVRELRLDGPPGHHLHKTFRDSGGHYQGGTVDQGYATMVRLIDLPQLASLLHVELVTRAQAAGMRIPLELGLRAGGQQYVLRVDAAHSRILAGQATRGFLQCRLDHLCPLLLGHFDVVAAASRGDLIASSQQVVEQIRALLPRLPFWYPAFDDLPA
jgi:predicted N-acetyltransferase YhbS